MAGKAPSLLQRTRSILRELRLAVPLAAMATTEAKGRVPSRVTTHSRSLLVLYEVAELLPNEATQLRDRRLVRLFTMSSRTRWRQLSDALERERARGMMVMVGVPLMLLRELLLVVRVDDRRLRHIARICRGRRLCLLRLRHLRMNSLLLVSDVVRSDHGLGRCHYPRCVSIGDADDHPFRWRRSWGVTELPEHHPEGPRSRGQPAHEGVVVFHGGTFHSHDDVPDLHPGE